jgi:hypothetical protein
MGSTEWQCSNCNVWSCTTCGQHFCDTECGACGGGCRCYCSCPTMRGDDESDFWS